mmetsp:Transcript_13392/g.30301  ORF Transcript_13392/g.30301 Transcript_13392/m.30301 type:complete len:106 (-) Transcript_13392:104-421(-)
MLSDVQGLAKCSLLHTIFATGCLSLSDVRALAKCRALRALHLNKCPSIRDVSVLGLCESLRILNLRCSGAIVVPQRQHLRVEFDLSPPYTPRSKECWGFSSPNWR